MSIIEHYKAARELTLQDGTMFELGKQRIDGQELLAFVNAPSSLRDMWLLATSHGDADYLVYNDERLSYRQAAVQVAGFAHWLVEHRRWRSWRSWRRWRGGSIRVGVFLQAEACVRRAEREHTHKQVADAHCSAHAATSDVACADAMEVEITTSASPNRARRSACAPVRHQQAPVDIGRVATVRRPRHCRGCK